MKTFSKTRAELGLSQRGLAARANVAFRTIQLIETGEHDPRLSTLDRLAFAMKYPEKIVSEQVYSVFELPPDSVKLFSQRMAKQNQDWKVCLFDFVDCFRKTADKRYVNDPPERLEPQLFALVTSTVETLCNELHLEIPWWCAGVPSLIEPWFVAGMENLKAMAIVSSPIHFRKRNIFVLDNFLDRV